MLFCTWQYKNKQMKYNFFNIKLDLLNNEEFFSGIRKFYSSEKCNCISFLNAHCFNIAQKNKEYFNALNESDLLLNDGIGIKIACLLSGVKPKENMNGTDLIPKTIEDAAIHGKKIYLLGGEEGIAEKAKEKICKLYPDAIISGFHSGFFSEQEEQQIIDEINNEKTDLLILGMGVPKQEIWAKRNKSILNNVSIIISGGAILDFLAEKFPRAPVIFRKLGLEWFFRLINEPKRLAKRYIIGNFVFMCRIIRLRVLKK